MQTTTRIWVACLCLLFFTTSCKEDKKWVVSDDDRLSFQEAPPDEVPLPQESDTVPPAESPRRTPHVSQRQAPPHDKADLQRMKEAHRQGRANFPACEQIKGPDLANNPELGSHDTGSEIGFVATSGKGHALDCFDAVKRPGTAHDFLITILDNGGAGKSYQEDQIARGFWDGNGKRCNWGREDLEGPDCPVCHPCATPQGRAAWQCEVKDYQEDLFGGGVNETRIAIQERNAGELYIPTQDCPSRLPNDNGETAYVAYFNQGPGIEKIPGESYIP